MLPQGIEEDVFSRLGTTLDLDKKSWNTFLLFLSWKGKHTFLQLRLS